MWWMEEEMEEVSAVKFEVMSDEVLQRWSVVEVESAAQVCDSRLGLPNSDRKCFTCGANGKSRWSACPGHWGRVRLPEPVFHPLFIGSLLKLLRTMCLACRRQHKASGKRKRQREGGGGGCKYCDGQKGYPKVKVMVVKKALRVGQEESVDGMEMEAGEEGEEVAEDYWSFVGGHPGLSWKEQGWRCRELLASEALEMLGKVREAEGLVVKSAAVAPNCARLALHTGCMSVKPVEKDPASRRVVALVKAVREVKENRSGEAGMEHARKGRESVKLQSCLSRLVYGSRMREGAPDENMEVVKTKSGKVWLKKVVLGKLSDFCFRGVVTGDPCIGVQEIGIPAEMAQRVTVPERVCQWNLKKVSRCGAVAVEREGERFQLLRVGGEVGKVKVGEVVHRHLQDGDVVIANRPPSAHKHSLIALRAVILPSSAIALNPLICPPFDADFDGDCFSGFVPQSLPAVAECRQLMVVEQQFLKQQSGQPIVCLTQDALLAAHLLLCRRLFLRKREVEDLAMFTEQLRPPPIPAIVKSPRGARWTGMQVLSMSLGGVALDLCKKQLGMWVQGGEVLWVAEEEEEEEEQHKKCVPASFQALAGALYSSVGAEETLKHLNFLQRLAIHWLSNAGFSLGLADFVVAQHGHRRHMTAAIKQQLLAAHRDAERAQLGADPCVVRASCNPAGVDESWRVRSRSKVRALHALGAATFQSSFRRIQGVMRGYMRPDNSFLAMVQAGSKGRSSMGKLVQQGGCVGLQQYKDNQPLPFRVGKCVEEVERSVELAGHWDSRGLISSSLLDGLLPKEAFVHSMCARSCFPRFGLPFPNRMFRHLMLFLRDVFLAHDGTARHRMGMLLLQFHHHGLEAEAGDAVGAMAATALAEPAYGHVLNAAGGGPLEVLDQTLFCNSKVMKEADRLVTLRLSAGARSRVSGQERAALDIQEFFKAVTLRLVATRSVIEYRGGDDPASPWLAHLQLDAGDLAKCGLCVQGVTAVVREKLVGRRKKNKGWVMESRWKVEACCECGSLGGGNKKPCLHLSYDAAKVGEEVTEVVWTEMLEQLRDEVLPGVLRMVVRGEERLEWVKIRWEDESDLLHTIPAAAAGGVPAGGELVVDVLVKDRVMDGAGRKWEKVGPGRPWLIVLDACFPIRHLVDWKRSSPGSVAEIWRTFGVDAARSCILHRLLGAAKAMSRGEGVNVHPLTLIADMMVQTGKVLGVTAAGYNDFLTCYRLPAPFTRSTFVAPIKTFVAAAADGQQESMSSSVIASAVWGRHIPLGTGADMDILWKEPLIQQMRGSNFCQDVHDFLSNKPAPTTPPPPADSPVSSEYHSVSGTYETVEGRWSDEEGEEEVVSSSRQQQQQQQVTSSSLPKAALGASVRDWCHLGPQQDVVVVGKVVAKPSLLQRIGGFFHPRMSFGSQRLSQPSAETKKYECWVREVLHHKYDVGQKLGGFDQSLVLQDLLPCHPDYRKKLGCGIKYVKFGVHPLFGETCCLFLVRTDGSEEDFSLRKCLTEWIRHNDPDYLSHYLKSYPESSTASRARHQQSDKQPPVATPS